MKLPAIMLSFMTKIAPLILQVRMKTVISVRRVRTKRGCCSLVPYSIQVLFSILRSIARWGI